MYLLLDTYAGSAIPNHDGTRAIVMTRIVDLRQRSDDAHFALAVIVEVGLATREVVRVYVAAPKPGEPDAELDGYARHSAVRDAVLRRVDEAGLCPR